MRCWWIGTFSKYKTDDLHTYGCVVSGEMLTGTKFGRWGGGGWRGAGEGDKT